MKIKNNIVTKCEFSLANGVTLVWIKQNTGWSITRYRHDEPSQYIQTISRLPSVENANYIGKLEDLRRI